MDILIMISASLIAMMLGILTRYIFVEKRHTRDVLDGQRELYKHGHEILTALHRMEKQYEHQGNELKDAIQDVKDAVESGPANQVMDGISNILNYNPFNQRNGGQEGVQR